MRSQIKPNRWSCVVTAFAMAIDISVADFIGEIGHDGSTVVVPYAGDPTGRQGFHIQECITVALAHGFSVTPIELFPASQFVGDHIKPITFPPLTCGFDGNWERFTSHIYSSLGVLTGVGRSMFHAVGFDRGEIHDPDDGSSFNYSRQACESRGFYSQRLWRVDGITK